MHQTQKVRITTGDSMWTCMQILQHMQITDMLLHLCINSGILYKNET